ncbi:hypothetical protein B0H13DRAFT_2426875 [Mycena leptocephala]|nr:hypothetical protein B0H13DRAFT_2426875 [Mycena leptocephala]
MDDWFPIVRRGRFGRSDYSFTFARESLGPPIRGPTPYDFADRLVYHNQIISHLEDNNSVYRGDTSPQFYVGIPPPPPPPPPQLPGDSDSDGESEVDQLSSGSSSPDIEMRSASPDDSEMRSSSPDDIELVLRSSGPDDRELSPAPTERVSSPFTPNGNRPHAHLKTYANRPKKLARAWAAAREAQAQAEAKRILAEAAKKRAARKKVLALRLAHPTPPTRRSRRTRCGRRGDNTDQGVFLQEPLSRAGNKIHSWIEKPRAIVDRKNVVMGVVAGAPKGQGKWWDDINKRLFSAMVRLYRNGDFSDLGEAESRIRFGVSFGEDYASPHQIGNFPVNLCEIIDIEVSEAFIVANAYQNHIYQQAAPVSYATVEGHVNDLIRREIAFPAFKNSVFTTSEISFGDAGSPLRKNIQAAIGTFEAVTVVGTWNHEKGGGIWFPEDDSVIQLKPGATRYFFRQYCHSGVLRWVEKGGRSDTEFDQQASPEQSAAWYAQRARRGLTSVKKFSKLGDVFVF